MTTLSRFRRRKWSSAFAIALPCALLLFCVVFFTTSKVRFNLHTPLHSPAQTASIPIPHNLASAIPDTHPPPSSTTASELFLLTSSAPTPPLNLSSPYTHPSLSSKERCSLFSYTLPNTLPPISVCLRPYRDLVSNHIRAHGAWSDCEFLVRLYTLYRPRYGEAFVDVGANIGACTFTLLAAGATVVAFEPAPSNLFYLTQTVAINRVAHPDWTQRLVVFPVGLGDETFVTKIYPEPGNAGNAVIGRPVLDNGTDVVGAARRVMDDLSFDISVHRLDDFFMNGETPILTSPVMKMDAQGFETRIVRGAKRWLAKGSAASLRYEVARDWLLAQGTSWKELYDAVVGSEFVVRPCGRRFESNSMQPKSVELALGALMERRGVTDCLAIAAREA